MGLSGVSQVRASLDNCLGYFARAREDLTGGGFVGLG